MSNLYFSSAFCGQISISQSDTTQKRVEGNNSATVAEIRSSSTPEPSNKQTTCYSAAGSSTCNSRKRKEGSDMSKRGTQHSTSTSTRHVFAETAKTFGLPTKERDPNPSILFSICFYLMRRWDDNVVRTRRWEAGTAHLWPASPRCTVVHGGRQQKKTFLSRKIVSRLTQCCISHSEPTRSRPSSDKATFGRFPPTRWSFSAKSKLLFCFFCKSPSCWINSNGEVSVSEHGKNREFHHPLLLQFHPTFTPKVRGGEMPLHWPLACPSSSASSPFT